jgi:hypothetical protein
MNLVEKISTQEYDKEILADELIRSPENIPQALEGLNNRKGSIKFGCDKILRLISERRPNLLYPHFEAFVEKLDSDNSILKWGAILVIANLAAVDTESKFENIFNRYFSPITDESMITAANIIGNSWKIAFSKPHLVKKITAEILKAENTNYRSKGEISPECNKIVCGYAIDSCDKFYDKISDQKPVVEFVKRQLSNTRKAVARKAEKFLRKHGKASEAQSA